MKIHTQEIIEELNRPREAIVDLKTRTIACVKQYLEEWDVKHPEWAVDERHHKAIERTVFMLAGILELYDEYDIGYRLIRVSDISEGEILNEIS